MDNNLERENQQKKQIAIMHEDEDGISAPNWLFEVLAWIKRIEMANSQLSFSCKLFKQLCWPKLHENVQPHKIKMLEFRGDGLGNSGHLRVNCQNKRLPIPIVQPIAYIIGIKYIYIYFLDAQLLDFVQNILPRLNKIKFSVGMHFYRWTLEDRRTKLFRRLLDLLADKIVKFIFHRYPSRVSEFNQHFPGFIQKVDYLGAYPYPTEFDILFKWLTLPSINGEKQQKILKLDQSIENRTDKFIERIKKEFSNANKPLNYFIKCPRDYNVAHFNNLENGKTGEILTSYRPNDEEMRNYNYNCIVRCPKGEEDYWKKEGHRKIRDTWDDKNQTYIEAQIDQFGDYDEEK